MKFDEICNYYSNSEPVSEARRGRPTKLYKATEEAPDMGFPNDSVEGRIIQFLAPKPEPLGELLTFMRDNFDEYYSKNIAKEKIRQMLLSQVLEFAGEGAGASDEREVPVIARDDEFDSDRDITDYLPPGAYDDYQQSYGGGDEY
jgi:hypothetical protein